MGPSRIHQTRSLLHTVTALFVLLVIAAGIYFAIHSSLFFIKSVQIEPLSTDYPLSVEHVMDLADIELGKESLFFMDLKPVELRLMQHPWVRGVVLSKQFPNALVIKIVERKPISLLNELNGRVLYIEEDGITFEDRSMVYTKDLPILSGFSSRDPERLKEVGRFIDSWFLKSTIPDLKLSSISYDQKNGLRAMVTYPVTSQSLMRPVLELGLNIAEASTIPQVRLKSVLQYLRNKTMSASRIWLGDGKKIVVKISRGQ
jgi:hypothetical protein